MNCAEVSVLVGDDLSNKLVLLDLEVALQLEKIVLVLLLALELLGVHNLLRGFKR